MGEEYKVRPVTDDEVAELVEPPQPIPLSERKPVPEDCFEIKNQSCTMHYCWLCRAELHAGVERAIWQWHSVPMTNDLGWNKWTHWLPASVDHLPARVQS
jgi:hypothetical protein